MRRPILISVVALLLSGCVAWRNESVETWDDTAARHILRGPGAEDAVALQWRHDLYRTDRGDRTAVGLFPGIGQAWIDGSVNGVTLGHSYWVIPFESLGANLLLGLPTLSSLFVAPFADATLSSLGIVGCHRWDLPASRQKIEDGESELVLVYDADRAVPPPPAVAEPVRTADGTPVYSSYPGFARLLEAVRKSGRADVRFADDPARLRRFTLSKLAKDALVYADVVQKGPQSMRRDVEKLKAPAVSPSVGAARLTNVAAIPVLVDSAEIGYVGSIDPSGGNADWDWGEVQDENGEWVLFEDFGPGCVYNFTQHRGETVEVPVFRFYFDGETSPRLTVRPKDFGNVPTLPKPLADAFCAVEHNRPFRIVRSFVPMEYRRGCRITSSVKLRGRSPAGGWGHVMFHRYRTAEGLVTYDPQRDVSGLAARFCGRLGLPPKATATLDERTLAAGESAVLFSSEGRGTLVETALAVKGFSPSTVTNLWLVYEFDGKRTVEAPLGTFFGCETPGKPACLETALLTFDTSDGRQARFSNRFPMPYFASCRVCLENRSAGMVAGVSATVGSDDTLVYDPKTTGLFTAARYLPKTRNVAGRNARIGTLVGRGQMAYGTITGWDFDHKKYGWGSCEGDVRCFVDDMTAPRVQSDGSESWGSWGWGFCSPPQVNPFSAYHSTNGEVLWSEVRLTYADAYPFRRFLRFDLEHGTSNNHAESSTSGQVFGYVLSTSGAAGGIRRGSDREGRGRSG